METPFGMVFIVVGIVLLLIELGLPGQLMGLLGAALASIGLAQLAWGGLLGPPYISGLFVLGIGFGLSAWAWKRWAQRIEARRRVPTPTSKP